MEIKIHIPDIIMEYKSILIAITIVLGVYLLKWTSKSPKTSSEGDGNKNEENELNTDLQQNDNSGIGLLPSTSSEASPERHVKQKNKPNGDENKNNTLDTKIENRNKVDQTGATQIARNMINMKDNKIGTQNIHN